MTTSTTPPADSSAVQVSEPSPEPRSEAASALNAAFGGDEAWELYDSRDSDVYVSATRVAKVAKHTDGEERLATGLSVAQGVEGWGVPAVQPLVGAVRRTDLGPASVWPRMDHLEMGAVDLDDAHASALGVALGRLSRCGLGSEGTWEPLARVPGRLERSTFPRAVLERTRVLLGLIGTSNAAVVALERTFAHGDMSIPNVLCMEDGSVSLIDFDSAGWRPAGWDMACLWVNVGLEGNNAGAFSAVEEAFIEETGALMMNLERMALIKATLATTFALTLEPTDARIDIVEARLGDLHLWAERWEVPGYLPPVV